MTRPRLCLGIFRRKNLVNKLQSLLYTLFLWNSIGMTR